VPRPSNAEIGNQQEELELERDNMPIELLVTRSKGEKAAQAAIASGGGTPARSK
jgi:hypothetical protein